MTRNEETKLVKDALAAAGINSRVGHGKGTAWGWLELNVGSADQFGNHVIDEGQSHHDCPPCRKIWAVHDAALKIAQAVTGRTGENNGDIVVLTQQGWNQTRRASEEIVQDVGRLTAAGILTP